MFDIRDSHFDVIVVGGGPAGLTAALFLGRSCRRVAVIDAGKPRNAAAREIHGFLGHDGAVPRDLICAGRKELRAYGVEILADTATRADRIPGQHPPQCAFSVGTLDGRQLFALKLLFATGMRDELPPIAGMVECYGLSVHHCPYCDGWEHRGKKIGAFACDVEAGVDLALMLRGWSPSITVLTNGHRVPELMKPTLQANGINFREEKIARVEHCDGRLQGVALAEGKFVALDALFFSGPQHPVCDLPKLLGCQCGEDDAAETGDKQRTSVPGVFVAGDADGDVQFAIVAAAEGAQAAVAINRELQLEDRTPE